MYGDEFTPIMSNAGDDTIDDHFKPITRSVVLSKTKNTKTVPHGKRASSWSWFFMIILILLVLSLSL